MKQEEHTTLKEPSYTSETPSREKMSYTTLEIMLQEYSREQYNLH